MAVCTVAGLEYLIHMKKMRSKQKKIKSGKFEKRTSFGSTISLIIGAAILLAMVYFLIPQGSDKWSVNDEGILSYPGNRGSVDVKVLKTESRPDYTLKTISFNLTLSD